MNTPSPVLIRSFFNEAAQLARAQYDDGNYREAIESADCVLIGDAPESLKLKALHTKGASLWELGRFAECLETIGQAGPLIDAAEPRSRASFHGQRALLYRKANEFDKALIDYEAARVWAKESGDREIEARVLNNLGKLYSDLDRNDEAITSVLAGIKLAEELHETILVGRFCDLLAQIYLKVNDYERSLAQSIRAINLLGSHASSLEALDTHALALRAASDQYLSERDPVERFRLRRVIVNGLSLPLDPETARTALMRCDGRVVQAAQLLNVKYPSLIKAAKKFRLSRLPKGHSRKKSLTTK